jgi:hypothetical protein
MYNIAANVGIAVYLANWNMILSFYIETEVEGKTYVHDSEPY